MEKATVVLGNFSSWLASGAKGRFILPLAFISLLFPLVVFPLIGSPSASDPSEADSIDLLFSYTPATAYRIISSYGEGGRSLSVRSHLTADLVYPILYAFALGLTISYFSARLFASSSLFQRLNLLPFAGMLADFAENSGIVIMLVSFPARLTALARLTSLLTSIKWLLAGAAIGWVALGLLALAIRTLRRSRTGSSI